MPPDNMSLPEPIFIQVRVDIWRHQAEIDKQNNKIKINVEKKFVYLVQDTYISCLWFMNVHEWSNMLCNWQLISHQTVIPN